MVDVLDKDLTASSIGEAFKQCIAHMKVSTCKILMLLHLAIAS